MARRTWVEYVLQDVAVLHLCLADSSRVANGMSKIIDGQLELARGTDQGIHNIILPFNCKNEKDWMRWGKTMDSAVQPLIELVFALCRRLVLTLHISLGIKRFFIVLYSHTDPDSGDVWGGGSVNTNAGTTTGRVAFQLHEVSRFDSINVTGSMSHHISDDAIPAGSPAARVS
jgi:hypothetical protein